MLSGAGEGSTGKSKQSRSEKKARKVRKCELYKNSNILKLNYQQFMLKSLVVPLYLVFFNRICLLELNIK